MALRIYGLAVSTLTFAALSASAFAQTVVPVVIESGNSGNYNNVRDAQFSEAKLGGPNGTTYYYIGDEDIVVNNATGSLISGSGALEDKSSVAAAHITVAGDAPSNPTVIYVFVAMSTDSGIGVRHALSPDGYFLKGFTFNGSPRPTGNVVPADIRTLITNYAANPGYKVNLGGSEVSAGTIIDLQNRFLNGVFAPPGGTNYSFTESTPLIFRDAANNSTKTLALTPTTNLPPAFPFSVGAQPVVFILKNHGASQSLGNTPSDNVKLALDNMGNVTSLEVSKIFSGLYKYWGEVGSFVTSLRRSTTSQSDFDAALAVANTTQIAAYTREPVSGTYNAVEETIMQGKGRSQEFLYNLPTAGRPGRGYRANTTDDPRLTGELGTGANVAGSPSTQQGPFAQEGGRVSSDGRMINSVKNVDFSIGYTFYGTTKFAQNGATTDTSSAIDGNFVHYVQVDGVDPLAKNSFDGNPKTGAQYATPGFTDVFGSYPAWTNIVLVFRDVNPDGSDPGTQAQAERLLSFRNRYASLTGQFLPKTQNLWIRSHRADAFTASPRNGTKTAGEAGNEDGGEIIQKLRDSGADGEFTGFHIP